MKLKITTDAYQSIVKKIGSGIPEKGGILLGKDGVITDFVFDENAETTGSTYSLNVAYLNPIIIEKKQEGKQLLGIIHSHPFGCSSLSAPDKHYFLSQFKNFPDLDYLFTPIVFSAKQGEFEFFPHVFHKDGTVETAELEIHPNDYEQYLEEVVEPTPDPETETPKQEVCIVINQTITLPVTDRVELNIGELLFYTALLTGFFTLGMLATLLFIIKIA